LEISVADCLALFFEYEYEYIFKMVLITELYVKNYFCSILLLLKKTSFQICFNQVSLRCRHLGVNTQAQTREKERAKWQTATGILKFR
jgi:hypothetical protein